MRPPFPYYGGKTRLAPKIAAVLPAHSHYVEPFAGSLSVLLAKEPSRIETVNDLDGELVNFWRVLRDRTADLERVCALTPYGRAEHQAAYEPATDEIERARRLWVLLSQGRSAIRGRTGWRESPPTSSMAGTLRGYVGRFGGLAERLSWVGLECQPALDVVERYGRNPEACLYVDPPYLAETRAGTGYAYEMPSETEHRDLLDALRECKAAVVLSGYDSPLYAEMLTDWHSTRMSAVTAQGRNTRSSSQRVEVLWSNRPLAPADELTLDSAA
jgi:DNA adenine methylase